jgi:hypothetical protein
MKRTFAIVVFVVVVGCRQDTPQQVRPAVLSKTEALAQEILRFTPEYVHFVEGTTFAWVLVPEVEADPALTTEVLRLLSKKYVVYRTESALPADAVSREGELVYYKDGFRFEFTTRQVDPSTVEVVYSDYEGPLAASSQTITYTWNGAGWVVKKQSAVLVSEQRPNSTLSPPHSRVTPLAQGQQAACRGARGLA